LASTLGGTSSALTSSLGGTSSALASSAFGGGPKPGGNKGLGNLAKSFNENMGSSGVSFFLIPTTSSFLVPSTISKSFHGPASS